jgi:Anthrone oxygenase
MQAPIAIVSAVLGAIAWWTTGDLLWVFGAVIMIANWPYTLLAIMPTNHQLEATPSGGDRDTRGRLIRWGYLHAVRSAFGAAATAVYLIAAQHSL